MRHTRSKTISIEESYTSCDRCGRVMSPDDADCEHQERLAIRFRAGLDAVFGDGSLVECDLCQHCVKAMLGDYLRITPDDPHEPQHRLSEPGEPVRAYQEYQLRQVRSAEALMKAVRKALEDQLRGVP